MSTPREGGGPEHAVVVGGLFLQEVAGGVLVAQHRHRCQAALLNHPDPVLPKQLTQRRQERVRGRNRAALPAGRPHSGTIARGPPTSRWPVSRRAARNADACPSSN